MPKKTEIDHYSDKEALDFHIKGKSGKIEINSSKPLTTKRDLSLAYSPGVAAPVKEIAKNMPYKPNTKLRPRRLLVKINIEDAWKKSVKGKTMLSANEKI